MRSTGGGTGDVFTVFSSVRKFPAFLERLAALPGRGDLLSITDLGYQDPVVPALETARRNEWRIERRDHHRWSEEECGAVRERVDILRVDTTRCGCGIAAVDLLPEDPVAREIASVVCDYDLWLHRDPRSAVLGQVLQRPRNRNHVRDLLVKGRFSDDQVEADTPTSGRRWPERSTTRSPTSSPQENATGSRSHRSTGTPPRLRPPYGSGSGPRSR